MTGSPGEELLTYPELRPPACTRSMIESIGVGLSYWFVLTPLQRGGTPVAIDT
jgi:hypothetical protein